MIFLVLRSVRPAVSPGQVTIGVARVLCWLLDVAVRVRRMETTTTTVPLYSAMSSSSQLLLLLQRPVDLDCEVVEPGPGQSPDMTGDYRDDPPVVVLSEHPGPPPGQPCEHPGPEVTGGVDGTARVVAETEAQPEDGDANKERNGLLGDSEVPVVSDGAHTDEEEGGGGELV